MTELGKPDVEPFVKLPVSWWEQCDQERSTKPSPEDRIEQGQTFLNLNQPLFLVFTVSKTRRGSLSGVFVKANHTGRDIIPLPFLVRRQ